MNELQLIHGIGLTFIVFTLVMDALNAMDTGEPPSILRNLIRRL